MIDLTCLGNGEFLVLYTAGRGEPVSMFGEEIAVIEYLQELGVQDEDVSRLISSAVAQKGVHFLASCQGYC